MKKYMNNSDERLDIHFRENLENFEATPNHNVWENIDAGIDIEGFDEIFNNKLTNAQQTPSPEVWEEVQKGIPLNLFVKSHLENLMKIAAVLLCFMSVTLYFTMDKNSNESVVLIKQSDIQPSTPSLNVNTPIFEMESEENEDFVYEIKKKKRKKRAKKATTKQGLDAAALWELLMEDEDEFADAMDENTKLQILSPPVRLPLIEESLGAPNDSVNTTINAEIVAVETDLLEVQVEAANTEENTEEIAAVEPDLKIWVPLVVVEKHEIEKLIYIYDQAVASKKNNDLDNQ